MKTRVDVPIGEDRARAVERVLASSTFARAGRSASILRYICGKLAEGKASEIKEYAIAVDIFDRADYDSRTDSRVRTEMKKVRDLLEQYYASEGAADSIRIDIPVGSYVPVFRELQGVPPEQPPSGVPAQPLRRRWLWVALAVTALAVITTSAWWFSREAAPGSLPSIAVMPIRDLSPGLSRQAFCDGLHDELISALDNVGGLRIASRSAATRYRNQDRDVRRVGEELKVHAVLEGSVKVEGPVLRVSLQLFNAKDGFQLWARNYDREDKQHVAVQKQLAADIQEQFRFYLNGATRRLARPGTRNADAWHYYLRAAQKFSGSDPTGAIPLYRAALQPDPKYALAMAGLSTSLMTLAEWAEAKPEDVMEEAHNLAESASRIDPDSAEVQYALGLAKTFYARDWAAAETAFRRAINADPTEAYYRLQLTRLVFAPTGRWDKEELEVRQALSLRPGWNALTNRLANLHLRKGELDLAAPLFERSIRENPRAPGAYVHLGEIAMLRGDHAEAMRRFDEAHQRQRSQWTIGHRGVGMALSGNKAEAQRILATLWSQYEIACIYNALGERDKAFGALESAVARREIQTIWMATEPRLQSIRGDPRFGELLGKLGLARPQ